MAVASDLRWNPIVLCAGHRADKRAEWCAKSLGMSEEDARRRVMAEFAALFSAGGPSWDPSVLCDGKLASARAQWCVESLGLSEDAARERVMGEFPTLFCGPEPKWDPDLLCGGKLAHGRERWCVEVQGLSPASARKRVMAEFPVQFRVGKPRWDPDVMCDGKPGESRVKWLLENRGLSKDAAIEQVMREFPAEFGVSDSGVGDGVAALGGPSKQATTLVPVAPADPEMLVWSDEFQYSGRPDPDKWTYDIGGDGWGNHELQYYTDREDNAWVSNGTLRIRAVREAFENRGFTSARLVTRHKAEWLYGRVEVRLRLPTARGTWPAVWLLPSDEHYGLWPNSGEIDVMEHVGYNAGHLHGTVHTCSYNHCKNTAVGRSLPIDVATWHTFAINWTPKSVAFIVDGQQYHEFCNDGQGEWETWPFDRRFFLILNVAVGGDWGGQKGVDEEAFEGEGQVMHVAWVRVYKTG